LLKITDYCHQLQYTEQMQSAGKKIS